MVRIKDMKMKKTIIKNIEGDVEEVRLTLDDMTVEDAREFLKKIGDMLDENRLHDNEPTI